MPHKYHLTASSRLCPRDISSSPNSLPGAKSIIACPFTFPAQQQWFQQRSSHGGHSGVPSLNLNGAVLHDIIIVGAGPCGLAVAACLREQNPAAIFTDEEHKRLHRVRRHMRNRKKDRASTAVDVTRSEHDTVVLDADFDTWMGR